MRSDWCPSILEIGDSFPDEQAGHFSCEGPMTYFRGEREKESQRDSLPSASFSNTFSLFSMPKSHILGYHVLNPIKRRIYEITGGKKERGDGVVERRDEKKGEKNKI